VINSDSITKGLVALPIQPAAHPWPTGGWSVDTAGPEHSECFNQLADEVFDLSSAQGVTYSLIVIKQGQVCYERYDAGASAFYLQYSWSMAKSITHALAGILAKQGKLDVYAPVDVPEWQNDARRDITLDQLLRMSSGLAFQEDYEDGAVSDVIPMLMFEGRHDMGAFAAAKALLHKPGVQWHYSSGTTNIICRILKDLVGDGASGMLRFMNDELFEPIGVRTATPKFDTSGTFIGSSYLMAIPQDFARFGLLYLRGGTWDGREILPPEWVDYARSPTYRSDEECYGAHWWMNPKNPNQFYCGGFDGQRILLDPDRDVVVVRCGRTPLEEMPYIDDRLYKMVDLV
jgi:CubicO group peptidase (beta-lactamase class C family)